MTREEFDEMFSKCSDDLKMKDPKEVIEKLKNYVDEGKTSISDKELAMFAYVESTMYADELVHSVLLKVLNLE